MKTDKETLEAVLKLYLDKDCPNAMLLKPFEQNGYVFACETHFFVKIPAIYLPGVYPTKYEPNISGINVESNYERHITISSLRSKLNHPSVPAKDVFTYQGKNVKCEECYDGQVEWSYTDRSGSTHSSLFDCPICDGTGYTSRRKRVPTGEKIKDPDAPIRFEPGVKFKHKFLNALLKTMELLDIKECIWTTQAPNNVNIFRLEDITVMIMPVL